MKKTNLRIIYRVVICALCVALTLGSYVTNAHAEPTASPVESAADATPEVTPSPTPALTKTPDPVNPYADLVLKDGDSGDDVISLQMRLRDLGYYNYKITGDFGSVTAQAVRDFQED
ncbi:MAG: peptidoglycan-binding protein, partial [Candidatus Spyradocola sp.]